MVICHAVDEAGAEFVDPLVVNVEGCDSCWERILESVVWIDVVVWYGGISLMDSTWDQDRVSGEYRLHSAARITADSR